MDIFKGMVYPKNENVVIIVSPSACSKAVGVYFFFDHKVRYFIEFNNQTVAALH